MEIASRLAFLGAEKRSREALYRLPEQPTETPDQIVTGEAALQDIRDGAFCSEAYRESAEAALAVGKNFEICQIPGRSALYNAVLTTMSHGGMASLSGPAAVVHSFHLLFSPRLTSTLFEDPQVAMEVRDSILQHFAGSKSEDLSQAAEVARDLIPAWPSEAVGAGDVEKAQNVAYDSLHWEPSPWRVAQAVANPTSGLPPELRQRAENKLQAMKQGPSQGDGWLLR